MISLKRTPGIAPVVTAFFLATISAAADEASVLVKAEPVRAQRLTDTLIGYGVVAPETGGVASVNFPRAGRVIALRVSLGQRVARGEPLFDVQTDAAGNLAYTQAATAVKFTQDELGRVESLAAQQLATQSQVEAAKKALADAQAQLKAQTRLGTESTLETFDAPYDGVVTALSVAQGDRIAAGAQVLQLARTDRLRAQLGIEPEDAARVKPGMPVRIVSVFNERHAVQAKVSRVQGMISPQTQLVDVVATFRNSRANPLLPGTRVRADIIVGSRRTLAVPRQAVLVDSKGAYLYQIKDGRAQRVDVTTGIESAGLIEVSGPIDPAQKIVVLGNYELRDGMRVREEQR